MASPVVGKDRDTAADMPVPREPVVRVLEVPCPKSAAAPWKTVTEYLDENLFGKPPATGDPDEDAGSDPTIRGGWAWRQKIHDAAVAKFSGFRLVKRLGGSSVSTVYLAENMENKEKMAIKVVNWSRVLGDHQRSVYRQLMEVYDTIPKHPNILKPLNRIVDGNDTFLVFDWCRNGSLAAALGPDGMFFRGVAETFARNIVLQICEGLQFLMKNSLPHGRLTLENVLLDTDFKIKLSDFGYPTSSCKLDDDFLLRYRPPEYVQGRPHTAFIGDIWSLGVVLFAMLHGHMPYSINDLRKAARTINMPNLEFRASLSFPCTLMVKRLLTFSPLFRPALSSVMKDKWLEIPPSKATTMHPSCHKDYAKCKQEAKANTTGQYFPSTHSSDTMPVNRRQPTETGFPATEPPSPKSDLTAVDTAKQPVQPSEDAAGETTNQAAVSQPLATISATTTTYPPAGCVPAPPSEAEEEMPRKVPARAARVPGAGFKSSLLFMQPLCPTIMEHHFLRFVQGRQCRDCYYKEYFKQFDDCLDLDKPWFRQSHRGKRMSPRIASMFTRYRAMSPSQVLLKKKHIPPESETESTDRDMAPSKQTTVSATVEIINQLKEFLKYSERTRAKFYRYHACVIPPNCREFPLPPLIIQPVCSNLGKGRIKM